MLVIVPDGIAKIELARIGRGTRDSAGRCADGRTCRRVAGRCTNHRSCACAQQRARCCAISGVRAAARQNERRRERRSQSESLYQFTASCLPQRFPNGQISAGVPRNSFVADGNLFGASAWAEWRNVMTKPFTKKEAESFFARLHAQNPEPKTELVYKNPYTLLVAVVLSAQATDKGVNKATAELFRVADTPKKMVALGEKGLTEHIKTIGLFRNKAKNVIALSEALIAKYKSEVPKDRDALEELPGVGRKTANVVLNVAFGEPTIAVDTHIFRVANRTGLAAGKTPRDVEDGLMKIVPEKYLLHAHHWLILLGRYICVARTPKCPECVVRDLCRFKEKTKA
jgi:endonuclease-3